MTSTAPSLRLILDTAEAAGPPRTGGLRFWTGREEVILRGAYPTGGVPACLGRLPGRSAASIYRHAALLGLRSTSAPASGRPRRTHEASDHIDALIRRTLQGKPASGELKKLARDIRRSRQWIRKRAIKLGCAVPRFKPAPWAAAETEIVEENAHLGTATLRARLLKAGFARTETAIAVQRKRLGASTADPDHYTATGLAALFGVDCQTVRRWIERGWLRASRRGTARVAEQGGDQWWIHRGMVRAFVVHNVAAVDFRKVDKTWLVDVLAAAPAAAGLPGTGPDVLFIPPVTVDARERRATCEGRSVRLTPSEVATIQVLFAAGGRHMTPAEIRAATRPDDDGPGGASNVVPVVISKLRAKLRGIGAPALIDSDGRGAGSRGYAIRSHPGRTFTDITPRPGARPAAA